MTNPRKSFGVISIEPLALGSLLALLFVPLSGFSQDGSVDASSPPQALEMEEVVVRSRMPLTLLRGAIYKAEDSYLSLFNALNSRDEFDIRCSRQARTGTRMVQRVCRARFYSDIEAEAAREYRYTGTSPQQYVASRSPVIRQKSRQLHAEMLALLETHSELTEALFEVDAAHERFDSERARRCAGRALLCSRD